MTGYFEEKVRAVREGLAASEMLKQCVFCFAFMPGKKPTLLTKPRVVVSLRGAEAKPVVVGGDGRQVVTEIGVDFYLPCKEGSVAALSLYSAAAERLLFQSELPVVKAAADTLRFDSGANALLLPASFWLEEVL